MNAHEWPCRIRSARQKKRLVKKDFDKQLIRLNKTRADLYQQKRNLPAVPLQHPYQRGWKRCFVLRDDVKTSPSADFYALLLDKINTVQHHHDRAFKLKKRRRKRYGYAMRRQELREISRYDWEANRFKLSEAEKACFTLVESVDLKTRRVDIKYVMAEPWRYVLKVTPHWVTHIKPLDTDIERMLAYINGYIDKHYLLPRINRLTRGRRLNWRDYFNERAKYINKFKNIPRCAPKEAYLDLET